MTKTNSNNTPYNEERIDQFKALPSSSGFDRFENLVIRIKNLFRISKFGFRIYQSSLGTYRNGRNFS